MAQRRHDLKDPEFQKRFAEAYNDIEKYNSLEHLGELFEVSAYTVYRYARTLKNHGHDLIERKNHYKQHTFKTVDEKLQNSRLQNEIDSLKKDLKEAEKQQITSQKLIELIHGIGDPVFKNDDRWLTGSKLSSKTTGIPTVFLSDIHFDEVVDPKQINMVNQYNRRIAIERLHRTIKTAVRILLHQWNSPSFDGIVVALGGDLLSGSIHDELSENMEAPIFVGLLRLLDVLVGIFEELLKLFDHVFVPCVVGNHGRLHKKPRAKNKVYDNYEWILYQYLARHFKDDDRITFEIPDSPDCIFKIYNRTYLLTHGDQFRGGNAIAGIFSPLMLGLMRKQKKHGAINLPFDTMLCGHFHQLIFAGSSLVINGSVKGYDEFANSMNFQFEEPKQALWINHPEKGMIFSTALFCDKLDRKIETREKIVVL